MGWLFKKKSFPIVRHWDQQRLWLPECVHLCSRTLSGSLSTVAKAGPQLTLATLNWFTSRLQFSHHFSWVQIWPSRVTRSISILKGPQCEWFAMKRVFLNSLKKILWDKIGLRTWFWTQKVVWFNKIAWNPTNNWL